MTPIRQEMKDLVSSTTQADRRWHGNLVWCSWAHGGAGRKAHPGHGGSLVGLDRKAAAELAEQLSRLDSEWWKWPVHRDVWLLEQLREWETKQQQAGSQSPGQMPGSSRPGLPVICGPRACTCLPQAVGTALRQGFCEEVQALVGTGASRPVFAAKPASTGDVENVSGGNRPRAARAALSSAAFSGELVQSARAACGGVGGHGSACGRLFSNFFWSVWPVACAAP